MTAPVRALMFPLDSGKILYHLVDHDYIVRSETEADFVSRIDSMVETCAELEGSFTDLPAAPARFETMWHIANEREQPRTLKTTHLTIALLPAVQSAA